MLGDVDPGPLANRIPQRHPLPWRRQVDRHAVSLDLRRPEHALGDLGDQHLQVAGRMHVVDVGLIPLEHRELGVVLVRDPFVAEVLAQLVDAVEAADDAALQVQLGGDSQVQVAVERVVVGGERARQRAAVERLQHRGLDLDEAAVVKPAANLADRLCTEREELPGGLVGDQVQLAAPVASLDVLQPVELVGRRPQALGQQPPAGHLQGELAAAGRESIPLDPDDVAEVEVDEQLEGLGAEHVLAGVQLDLAAAVAQVQEGGLAVPAAGDQPAGDAMVRLGLQPRRQALVRGPDLADLLPLGELVRERIDPLRPQPLQLLPPLGEKPPLVCRLRRPRLTHGGRAYPRQGSSIRSEQQQVRERALSATRLGRGPGTSPNGLYCEDRLWRSEELSEETVPGPPPTPSSRSRSW